MTTTTENTVPAGYMQDSRGRLVPEDQVREQDKLRNQVVLDLIGQAQEINRALKCFKQTALSDIADVIQIAADRWDVDLGGKKGNISLSSFDGQYRVQRVYAERISFTEELEAAKELFGRCLDRWTEDADTNVRALIDRAFRPNKAGQIRTAELLGLLRLEIDDPEWKQACDALKQSISIDGSTVYIRVYERIGGSDSYRHIPLDLAGV